jgi:hypothetical protein
LVAKKIKNNINICFLNLKDTFRVTQKEKSQEKVWRMGMGFRRRTRLWHDKLEKRARTAPAKAFPSFSSPTIKFYREQSVVFLSIRGGLDNAAGLIG